MKTTTQAHARCTSCSQTFKTEKAFQTHDCVKGLLDVPLEQLMAMYEARRAGRTN
jgi:hypothetical protein